ncbi:MAG: phosphoenolpyruvate--protein phosphotransferase [Chloroflexi bacterium]|nr:phosphoenolpyruvate--protein phosphotransferase [Chloroflexota bacterium]
MKTLRGIPASPGIALGPALIYQPPTLQVERRHIQDPGAEGERFTQAVVRAKAAIADLQAQATARLGPGEAAIFEAHRLFLEDPVLLDKVRQRIAERVNAEAALLDALEGYAQALASLPDETFRQRAADVRAVGERVLRELMPANWGPAQLGLNSPRIVVARDLTPADTIQMDPSQILGLVTALGGPTSHAAILARGLGIPAVMGLGEEALAEISSSGELVLDGTEGVVLIDADAATREPYLRQRERFIADREQHRAEALLPAQTRDGRRIEIGANVGDVESAVEALSWGADGIGLLRSEFLYLRSELPPSEAEQVQAYREITKAWGERPMVIRTLDIGADKPLPWLRLGQEANPFLGTRGLRLSLQYPHLLKTQLRAILRIGAGYNVKIMFPMVATIEEMREAKRILAEARQELQREDLPIVEDLEVGIMVEVPSAALMAAELAAEADFFSLGTNDLVQYLFACDRTNPRVIDLYQPLHPAVLRLIRTTVEGARAHGRWVGLCGELAGVPEAIPILVGLGLDELSMNPPSIPQAKAIVRSLSYVEAQSLAERALQLSSELEVRGLIASLFPDLAQLH